MTQENLAFNQNAVYEFQTGSIFLQGQRGLIDSVHRVHEDIFKGYKLLKRQDWDELEFPLVDARADFSRFPKHGEMMKNNIGWQWSGDSAAANSLVPMVAPFQPCADAWLWFVKQGENENLHALSYSECVKISVPDGMREILRIHRDQDTMRRVNYITEVFDHVMKVGAKMQLGLIDWRSEEASDALMLMLCAIFCLERQQFMPSFANTAALFFQSMFVPIGQTVQKIAIDEWGTHIPQIRRIIQHELTIPERRASMKRIEPLVRNLIEEVAHNEVAWNTRQFQIGGEQIGMTEKMGADYEYYAATDVANELGIVTNVPVVTRNPLPMMDNFLNLNREQKAVMEGKGGNYQTVAVKKSSGGVAAINIDDL